MTQPPETEPTIVPRCYRHPGRETLIRCTRCDRPICPDCMRPASVGFHCPDDVERGVRSVRQPRTTFGALVRQSPPYATATLIALNVATYLATGLQSGGTLHSPAGSTLFSDWVLEPAAVHGQDQYYRLLTSAFLHLSPLHIISNMVALLFVGPVLERAVGRWRFSLTYLLAALGGGAVVYAFGNHVNATAGASGAIFGLFGVCLVLARRIGLDLQWLIGIIVLNFVLTFSISNISKLAHVGGFVTGLLIGVVVGGLPSRRTRVPTGVQVSGLFAVFAAVLVVTGVGTATW